MYTEPSKTITGRIIQTPRLVILGAIIVCMLGFAAVFTLPKERTPRIKLPVIVVAVPNLGAAPPTNESQIVRRIEEASGNLDGLRDEGGIRGEAVHGAGLVQFVFDDGVDVIEAKRDVESMINRVKGEFPPDAQTDPGPLINDIAFDDWPIIQVLLSGGTDGKQRRQIAESLQTELEQVPGVSGVNIFGGLEDEVQIEINPDLMALYGFTFDDVARTVARANQELPTGTLEMATGSDRRVRVRGKVADLDSLADVALGTREGSPVYLRDVATVTMSHKPQTSIARYKSQDAVVLLVQAKTDINVLAATERVKEIVDHFVAEGRAQNTSIGTVRAQSREISYMINQLGWSAIYGTLVVFALLWLFMGFRNALLIGLAVPFAVFATGAMMWIAKRTIMPDLAINNMSMFAMILVIGMVVDGCIIVGENIFRHREIGRAPLEAAQHGIDEVGLSLVTAYLTTFAAFGPMYLVRGVMGDFMSVLPTVVVLALVAAMLVDHYLLPVLSVYVMRARKQTSAFTDLVHQQASETDGDSSNAAADDQEPARHLTAEQIEIMSAEISAEATRMQRVYGRMLRYCLNHRLLVVMMSIVLASMPAALYFSGAIGTNFFPEGDIPIVEIDFELPLGSSMEQRTVDVAARIEDAVNQAVRPDEWYKPGPNIPAVGPVTTIGEPGALNTRLDSGSGMGPEFGKVYVELVLAEHRDRSVHEIRQAIADAIPPMPGVIVRATVPTEGPPAGAPVMVRIFGNDDTTLDDLAARADRIEQLLQTIPGTYDVSNDYRLRPEVLVDPQDARASLFNIDVGTIKRSVNYALEGVLVGEVDFGSDEQIDIRVRTAEAHRDEIEDLSNLPIRTADGRVINLDQVASVRRTHNANVIRRYERKRVISVRSELEEGYLPQDVRSALVKALRPELTPSQQRQLALSTDEKVLLADNTGSIEFGGEMEVQNDALEDLTTAAIVAMAGMMVILTLRFNSFIQPLIILFSVPLSLVGVFIGLMTFGFYFSVSAMIGLVALSGIVVNDAIVLVDFINRLKRAGVPIKKAVVYAGQLRLRPIFLTTVTTIGGLLPLSLNLAGGGEFWQPLTITIMCGLGFATLLQLIIIPLAIVMLTFEGSSLLDPANHPGLSGNTPPPPPAEGLPEVEPAK